MIENIIHVYLFISTYFLWKRFRTDTFYAYYENDSHVTYFRSM
jgi:hypothetical protein